MVKAKRSLPKCVRPEEFKALISKVPSKDTESKIIFLLAYGAGLRVSEVASLQVSHFRDNSILIEESKYGRDRIVPIPKGFKKSFLDYFPIKVTVRTMQRRFRKYAAKAKLDKRYSFHSLRHGFAVRCLEEGIPMNQLQLLLGHENMATTSVYTKANPKDAIKSYEELF